MSESPRPTAVPMLVKLARQAVIAVVLFAASGCSGDDDVAESLAPSTGARTATRTMVFDAEKDSEGCVTMNDLNSDAAYYFVWSPSDGSAPAYLNDPHCNDVLYSTAGRTISIEIPPSVPVGDYKACVSRLYCQEVRVG
jgi:hypothetical protein